MIRAGYDIAFNCIQRVPMLLMLSVHPFRRSDLLSEDKIEFSPKVQTHDFKDALAIFVPPNGPNRSVRHPQRVCHRRRWPAR
jgi:hypothetical protein